MRFESLIRLSPVIEDRGIVLNDSEAILQYLDANYPEAPRLLPGSRDGRHECEVWKNKMDKGSGTPGSSARRWWDGQPSSWTTTPDGTTVLFHAQERGKVHLYALPIAGGAPRLVARGGRTGQVAAGPEGSRRRGATSSG